MRHIHSYLKTLGQALVLGSLLALAGQVHANDEEFSQGQLEQILAPIALYPDTVLSHILIAATYPLEVVQAARWARNHPNLSGEEALNAAEGQGWDPSVTALAAFPQVLERMDEDLGWTQNLGEAFLLDEARVIDTIQDLRQRAYESGHLNDMEHVRVEREDQTIIIEPVRREVVYVPYYDTRVVYGHWHWSHYPPVYWHYPGSYYGSTVVYWGHGVRVSPRFYFSSVYWPQRHVVVIHHNRHHRHRYYGSREIVRYRGSRRWEHNPQHRRGAVYHSQRLNRSYNVNRSYTAGQSRDTRQVRGSRRAEDIQLRGRTQQQMQERQGGSSQQSVTRSRRDRDASGDRRQSRRTLQPSGDRGDAQTRRGGSLQRDDSSSATGAPTRQTRPSTRRQSSSESDSSSSQALPTTQTESSSPRRSSRWQSSDGDSGSSASSRSSTRSSGATSRSSRSSGATSRSNRSSGATSGSSRSQGSSRGSRRSR